MVHLTGEPVLFPGQEVLCNALEGHSDEVRRTFHEQLQRRVLARVSASDPAVVVCRYTAEFEEAVLPISQALAAGWVRWTPNPDGPCFPLVRAETTPGTSFVLICPETDVTDLLVLILSPFR